MRSRAQDCDRSRDPFREAWAVPDQTCGIGFFGKRQLQAFDPRQIRLDARLGLTALNHGPAAFVGVLAGAVRRRGLAERFHDLLDELFEDRIVEWTLSDAQACARIMEDKRRRGEALDDHVPDAFLAAAAAMRGLAIVTRNTGGFRNTGVEAVNPRTEART